MDCDRAIERAKMVDCQEENQFTSRFPFSADPVFSGRARLVPRVRPAGNLKTPECGSFPNLLPDHSSLFSPADCRNRLR
jgi:hypothetical protein